MTEEQAIERIEAAMVHAIGPGGLDIAGDYEMEVAAKAAWNEIKAIAREADRDTTMRNMEELGMLPLGSADARLRAVRQGGQTKALYPHEPTPPGWS